MAVEVGTFVARSVVEPVVGRNKVGPADSPVPNVIEPSVGRDGDVDISNYLEKPPACEFYAALAGKAQRCTRTQGALDCRHRLGEPLVVSESA